MKFIISTHAIERYIERIRQVSYVEAEEAILTGLMSGGLIRRKTLRGQQIWKFGSEDVLAVVKRDKNDVVCVTILPSLSDVGNISEAEIEIYRSEAEAITNRIGVSEHLLDQDRNLFELREVLNFRVKQLECAIEQHRLDNEQFKLKNAENITYMQSMQTKLAGLEAIKLDRDRAVTAVKLIQDRYDALLHENETLRLTLRLQHQQEMDRLSDILVECIRLIGPEDQEKIIRMTDTIRLGDDSTANRVN